MSHIFIGVTGRLGIRATTGLRPNFNLRSVMTRAFLNYKITPVYLEDLEYVSMYNVHLSSQHFPTLHKYVYVATFRFMFVYEVYHTYLRYIRFVLDIHK